MNHASLFSGIGGFDLAAEWMGWTNVLHCERDPFCQRVLQYHFPNAKTYNDVKTFDGTEWRGRVDILTGGFPCQPYSSAGKRLGKDDERHLWPQMCRIISEVAPAYVVGENVRGLLNWNGGVVFEEVCADLEAMGYEVWTGILPAAGVGAPHRRDRVWWVATNSNNYRTMRGSQRDASQGGTQRLQERDAVQRSDESGSLRVAANAESAIGKRTSDSRSRRDGFADNCGHRDAANADGNQRPEGRMHKARPNKAARHTRPCDARPDTWQNFPTQPPVCGGDDGLLRELDGITFSKWRAESIKAYGNAIVPQVAYQIFKAIQTTHDN
jgi:DNA (cytosine-5)-methyltransferase 1